MECQSVNPEIFFDRNREIEAKAVCDGCPMAVAALCRKAASNRMEPFGVYGGESGSERIGRLIREAADNAPEALLTALAMAVAPDRDVRVSPSRETSGNSHRNREALWMALDNGETIVGSAKRLGIVPRTAQRYAQRWKRERGLTGATA